MTNFTVFGIGFWLGIVIAAAIAYYGTHPTERAALLSRVKGWFKKVDSTKPPPGM
jgi:hypothetical protein